MKPLLIIGGATGSGKSALAVALAKRMKGEIVSADSMQIYRGLDVGTAKVTSAEMQGIPHHMIDVVDPDQTFTAADYKVQATAIIAEIEAKGKLPILCGGTGLYINAILYDLSFSGDYDPALRSSLQEEAKEIGKVGMHAKLCALDPDAGARLHVNDEKRVLRAIEKALTGGKKEEDLRCPKYPFKMFVTDLPREFLYERIDLRVDQMMKNGLKEEVDSLLARGIGYDRQCMQAIAYKEWAGRDAGMSDDEIVALIKKNTRNYAKRQGTWFRQYHDAVKIDMLSAPVETLAERIQRIYDGEITQ